MMGWRHEQESESQGSCDERAVCPSVCLSVCLTTKTLQMYNVSHDLDLQSLHDELFTCVVHLATCMLQTASSPQQTPVDIPIFALSFLPGQILRQDTPAGRMSGESRGRPGGSPCATFNSPCALVKAPVPSFHGPCASLKATLHTLEAFLHRQKGPLHATGTHQGGKNS